MDDVIELLRERLAPRYDVDRQIGAGGMARVYLATEEHPRRPVAIKILEPSISSRLMIDRFIREVELASRLSHPHIVPIFAAGEVGGLLYYVMPYIEGESLRQRLLKERHLPLADALHLVLDVADALAYAHQQGVVHRDIKPENILLSGGHPIVADFGIARAISAAGGQALTATGHAVGSPGYMSPEQAMGIQVDTRTDVYSLGCVLFELLTGDPPVRAGLDPEIVNWSDLDTRGALRGAGGGEARAVKHAISRALAPVAADRFGSVNEFSDALGGSAHRPSLPTRGRLAGRRGRRAAILVAGVVVVAGGAALTLGRRPPAFVPGRVVVAVLDNHTGDAALDPVGHMAADWVTQGLTQTGLVEVVPSVNMVASATTTPHGAGNLDVAGIRALGRDTRAGTVVTGAYYRQGDSLRFQVEISDAADGKVLRALDPVVGSVANPLAAVEVVRQRVMTTLATLFNPKLAGWGAAASQPPDYQAYQEFIEGLDRYARFDYSGARDHFDRAAARDSTFSVAAIWSAAARINVGQHAGADSIVKRLEASSRPLAPVDRSYLGWVAAVVRGDAAGALDAARELARLAPASDALFLVSQAAMYNNRPHEAVASMEALDPDRGLFRTTYVYAWNLTSALHMLGEHRRELKEAEAGRRRTPGIAALAVEARALAALGRLDEVRQRLDEGLQLQPEDRYSAASVALLVAQELRSHGYAEAAREAVGKAIAWYEAQQGHADHDQGFELAQAYFEAGRLDDAYRLLRPYLAMLHQGNEMERYYVLGALGATAARQGNRGEALRMDSTLEAVADGYMMGAMSYQRARIHALLGDKDAALELLRAAFRQGLPEVIGVHTDLAFQSLRDDPGFQELMRPKG